MFQKLLMTPPWWWKHSRLRLLSRFWHSVPKSAPKFVLRFTWNFVLGSHHWAQDLLIFIVLCQIITRFFNQCASNLGSASPPLDFTLIQLLLLMSMQCQPHQPLPPSAMSHLHCPDFSSPHSLSIAPLPVWLLASQLWGLQDWIKIMPQFTVCHSYSLSSWIQCWVFLLGPTQILHTGSRQGIVLSTPPSRAGSRALSVGSSQGGSRTHSWFNTNICLAILCSCNLHVPYIWSLNPPCAVFIKWIDLGDPTCDTNADTLIVRCRMFINTKLYSKIQMTF